jgi:hypothetical protein
MGLFLKACWYIVGVFAGVFVWLVVGAAMLKLPHYPLCRCKGCRGGGR